MVGVLVESGSLGLHLLGAVQSMVLMGSVAPGWEIDAGNP